MMYAELSAAMASVKAATELVMTAVSAQQRAKVQQALTEANERLYQLSAAALASQEEVSRLKEATQQLQVENARLRNWQTEAERYAPKEVAPGVFAYVEQGSVQPMHSTVKLCATCYERREKSFLQQEAIDVGRQIRLRCFACRFDVTFRFYLQPQPAP